MTCEDAKVQQSTGEVTKSPSSRNVSLIWCLMSDDTIIVGSSTSSSMYVDRWSRVCVYGSRDDACAQMTEYVCSVAHAACLRTDRRVGTKKLSSPRHFIYIFKRCLCDVQASK